MLKSDAINIDQITTPTVLLLGEGHRFTPLPLAPIHRVASRLGVTVRPQSAATLYGYHQEKLCIKPFIGDNIPSRTVVLAWRASFPRFNAIDILCEAIKPV